MSALGTLRRDIDAIVERDPAARNRLEVVLYYPGLHALWAHRLAHHLWKRGWKLVARGLAAASRGVTGIEIHPAAVLGQGLVIDHGVGVVIGETAEVGDDVTIYHGVTLGGTSLERGKRHPTVRDRVTVGAGAKILGPIEVGSDSRIGANAVVVRPVPSNSVVIGVPGQVIARGHPHSAGDKPDLDHIRMPDLVGVSLQSLLDRVDALETEVTGRHPTVVIHPPDHGVWHGEDFSI